MFVIYGLGFAAMSAALILLHLHAWRRRDALELDEIERHETRANVGAWMIMGGVSIVSVLTGVLAPPSMIGLPGWPYATLGIVMPLYGRALTRRRPDRAPPR